MPHVLFDLPLSQVERDVMLALLKLQDEFLKGHRGNGWFFCTVKLLAQYARHDKGLIKKARRRLKYMNLIDYEIGGQKDRKAIRFKILIDDFYLADHKIKGV